MSKNEKMVEAVEVEEVVEVNTEDCVAEEEVVAVKENWFKKHSKGLKTAGKVVGGAVAAVGLFALGALVGGKRSKDDIDEDYDEDTIEVDFSIQDESNEA